MKANKHIILEEVILKNGMEIDLEEGWKKLISRQFGGDPGRGFSELIQNLLDSYPSKIPMNERKGIIETGNKWISITDYGEGLNRKKLELITTMGGTDKSGDKSKIGRFGIGFFSIFNPRLGTKQVQVTTNCEGYTVELTFDVTHPEKRPELNIKVLPEKIDYSTKVKVVFNDYLSVQKCINWARKSLTFYPCNVIIDGKKFISVWDKAIYSASMHFSEQNCNGFIEEGGPYSTVALLCKYELVKNLSLPALITGGYNMKFDLRDYSGSNTPYIPNLGITINSDNLSLTISRDSYYLDYNYTLMKNDMNKVLQQYLYKYLQSHKREDLILANLYILRSSLRALLNKNDTMLNDTSEEVMALITLLNAPVFRINGRKNKYSVMDIKKELTPGLPLFYSPDKLNLRWLGGDFKHDFIVLPESYSIGGWAPEFYDLLFYNLFTDIINLDKIDKETYKMRELVAKGIIKKSSLSLQCKFIGEKQLYNHESKFLKKINKLLNNETIQKSIEDNLHLPVRNIRAVFFDVKKEGAYLSTGLFEENGRALDDDFISNMFQNSKSKNKMEALTKKNDIVLGLRLNHPFIQYLINCEDEHIEYYALTYIANELALCQKILVPYSPLHHLVKDKLAQSMRISLIRQITGEAA